MYTVLFHMSAILAHTVTEWTLKDLKTRDQHA